MSQYRLHADLIFDTEEHAEAIRQRFLTAFTVLPHYASVRALVRRSEGDEPLLFVDASYETSVDGEALRTWIRTQVVHDPVVQQQFKTGWERWHDAEGLEEGEQYL